MAGQIYGQPSQIQPDDINIHIDDVISQLYMVTSC
jgi:hypothetical protein